MFYFQYEAAPHGGNNLTDHINGCSFLLEFQASLLPIKLFVTFDLCIQIHGLAAWRRCRVEMTSVFVRLTIILFQCSVKGEICGLSLPFKSYLTAMIWLKI